VYDKRRILAFCKETVKRAQVLILFFILILFLLFISVFISENFCRNLREGEDFVSA
jgi:hypothetical protein